MFTKIINGQSVNITNDYLNLNNLYVGLDWYSISHIRGFIDPYVAALLLDKNNQVKDDNDFVFFNNLKHDSCAVEHLGDRFDSNRMLNDWELIAINLSKIPQYVQKIVFTVSIYDGKKEIKHLNY